MTLKSQEVELIRKLSNKRKSSKEIANITGFSVPTINKWKSIDRDPTHFQSNKFSKLIQSKNIVDEILNFCQEEHNLEKNKESIS